MKYLVLLVPLSLVACGDVDDRRWIAKCPDMDPMELVFSGGSWRNPNTGGIVRLSETCVLVEQRS